MGGNARCSNVSPSRNSIAKRICPPLGKIFLFWMNGRFDCRKGERIDSTPSGEIVFDCE